MGFEGKVGGLDFLSSILIIKANGFLLTDYGHYFGREFQPREICGFDKDWREVNSCDLSS